MKTVHRTGLTPPPEPMATRKKTMEQTSMNYELTSPDLATFLNQETKTPNLQIEYAASPYWHPRIEIRRARATAAAAVLELIKDNEAVFSPVVYSAVLQEQYGFSPPDGWYDFDLNFLAVAAGLTILEIPGWEHSRGILIEMGFARGRELPIRRIEWPEIQMVLDSETIRVLES